MRPDRRYIRSDFGVIIPFFCQLCCLASGNVIQETVWLGDLPVAVLKPGAQYYVNPDHLGAPRYIMDSSGAIVWKWDKDPFGNGAPTGSLTYNLRFPGQYFDSETGLYYNMARDYNPGLGRYIQSDSIWLRGGVNTYAYVGGDPINFVDPDGSAPISAIKKALEMVYEKIGGRLLKCKPGKFGSPQRGTPQKGYRLDPPHPDAKPGSPESGPHINWWDYTAGKRGNGGRSGAEPIIGGILGIIGGLIDPFGDISWGEIAIDEDYADIGSDQAGIGSDQCDNPCPD
ncbi:MAG: hypothetical protein HQK56_15100 [Deltaproteobacteria bacterium]|nr:hypothetical protein [Deltaproteobacteria bacterium]